jgi:hypothetical protein
MLKIRLGGDGPPVIVLGLSRVNVERLMRDEPIRFDLAEVGMQGAMVIVGGETDRAVVAQLVEYKILPGAVLQNYQDPQPGEARVWLPE